MIEKGEVLEKGNQKGHSMYTNQNVKRTSNNLKDPPIFQQRTLPLLPDCCSLLTTPFSFSLPSLRYVIPRITKEGRKKGGRLLFIVIFLYLLFFNLIVIAILFLLFFFFCSQ